MVSLCCMIVAGSVDAQLSRLVVQFGIQQGVTATLRSDIKSHRNTWVTESDFALMASIGVNCVRIPLGYWVVAMTPVRQRLVVPLIPFVKFTCVREAPWWLEQRVRNRASSLYGH